MYLEINKGIIFCSMVIGVIAFFRQRDYRIKNGKGTVQWYYLPFVVIFFPIASTIGINTAKYLFNYPNKNNINPIQSNNLYKLSNYINQELPKKIDENSTFSKTSYDGHIFYYFYDLTLDSYQVNTNTINFIKAGLPDIVLNRTCNPKSALNELIQSGIIFEFKYSYKDSNILNVMINKKICANHIKYSKK